LPVPAFPYLRTDDLSGLLSVHCPGHSPSLKSLTFCSGSGDKIWIAGDAILDEEWLRAWKFFWPNGYTPSSVIQTWKSVARIIANADVIVPGHGKPFRVTLPLVEKLLSDFPAAEYAGACGKAADMMADRLNRLKKRELTS
jgi:glyoxylase-like metal-dependent hydrolase (beta-lactamase superfamily II)